MDPELLFLPITWFFEDCSNVIPGREYAEKECAIEYVESYSVEKHIAEEEIAP